MIRFDDAMQPFAGTVIGRYLLRRQLGQGGMGSVWEAEHTGLRASVAVKLIDPAIAGSAEALSRFMREAQAAASLRSPHVVQILDYGVDQGHPYIAMELLEGESLAARLQRAGRLSARETAMIMTHVARAIGKAHEAGIVHRDLKPDNIFIIRNDDEEVAKVLDFGVAKATGVGLGASAGSGTRTGALLGTPYYMSPEQAEGTKAVDHRTDVWAMGVIAFECLVGRRPFESEALGSLLLAICTRPLPVPSELGPVPPGFDAWFAEAAARDLSQRFSSAKQAANELRAVCGMQDEARAAAPSLPFTAGTQSLSAPARSAGMAPAPGGTTTAGITGGVGPTTGFGARRGLLALSLLVVLIGTAAGALLILRRSGVPAPTAASSAAPAPAPSAQTVVQPEQPPLVLSAVPSARPSPAAVASPAPAASIEPPRPKSAQTARSRPPSKTTKPQKTAPSEKPAATSPPKVDLGI